MAQPASSIAMSWCAMLVNVNLTNATSNHKVCMYSSYLFFSPTLQEGDGGCGLSIDQNGTSKFIWVMDFENLL